LFPQVLELKKELEKLGFIVLIHEASVTMHGKEVPVEQYNVIKKGEWNDELQKTLAPKMRDHFEKIEKLDAIVVMNKDKEGRKNYIGGNTLIEMGLAFYLQKQIFLTNPIPTDVPYVEEIRGVSPIILTKLEDIKEYLK